MDRAKMQLFDAEQSAQDDLDNSTSKKRKKNKDVPVMDETQYGERYEEDMKATWKSKKKNFDDFMA
jgi:hypothetical protein